MFKSIIWSSMLDWPGTVCTTLFVGKCSWACPYCHNKELFKSPAISFKKEILPKLIARIKSVDHVIISGGEPTEYWDLLAVIKELKLHKFKVGLHTNGSGVLPVYMPFLDFVAMDIKTVFTEDDTYGYVKSEIIKGFRKYTQQTRVCKNIKLLTEAGKNGFEYEFRTTLSSECAPLFIIPRIAEDLADAGATLWTLQNNVTESFNKFDVQHLLSICDPRITIELRGF